MYICRNLNYSAIRKSLFVQRLFHCLIVLLLNSVTSEISAQSIQFSDDFSQNHWPEFLDNDTLYFTRNLNSAQSRSDKIEKHEFQLKLPLHPSVLLQKINEFQSLEIIEKYQNFKDQILQSHSTKGFFGLRFGAEINLSSVNRISIILKDSQSREIKLNWGNTKDQLEVYFLGQIIYTGPPFEFNSSKLNQSVLFEFNSDTISIITFTESTDFQLFSNYQSKKHTIKIPLDRRFGVPFWGIFSIAQSGKSAIGSHRLNQLNWGWGQDIFVDSIQIETKQISNNQIELNLYSKNYWFQLDTFKTLDHIDNRYQYQYPKIETKMASLPMQKNTLNHLKNRFSKNTQFRFTFDRNSLSSTSQGKEDSVVFVLKSQIPSLFYIIPLNHSDTLITSNQFIVTNCALNKLDTAFANSIYISEIMSDPEPNLGRIPALQYVEIVNIAGTDIDLGTLFISKNSKFINSVSIGTRIDIENSDSLVSRAKNDEWIFSHKLAAGKYALITNAIDSVNWSKWLRKNYPNNLNELYIISAVGLPRFNFSDGVICIFNNKGETITRVNYSSQMHLNEFKDGGVSLELTNPSQPYSWEFNASSNPNFGGSPAIKNKIDTSYFPYNQTITPYKIIDAYCDHDSIFIIWNHPLPLAFPTLKLYEYRLNSIIPTDSFLISSQLNIQSSALNLNSPSKQSNPCNSQHLYRLDSAVLNRFFSKQLNKYIFVEFQENKPIKFHNNDSKLLRFNEILSNNFTGFSDYFELVNIDSCISVDLENWDLLYYDENNILKHIVPLKNNNFRFIQPNQYKVFTDDRYSVYRQFPNSYPFNFAQINRFPDLSTSTGRWLLNHHIYGIQDEINMSELNKNFPNLVKGFSLEKMNPHLDSKFPQSWFPFFASNNSKSNNPHIPISGGTPGEKNSNYKNSFLYSNSWLILLDKIIHVNSNQLLILPIEFHLPSEGYSLSGSIYNSSGRQICTLNLPDLIPQNGSLFVNLPEEIHFNGNYVVKFEATLHGFPTKRVIQRITVIN